MPIATRGYRVRYWWIPGITQTRAGRAGLVAVSLGMIVLIYWSAIATIISTWLTSPEFNYGPIVPFIAIAMYWRDVRRAGIPASGGWLGCALVAMGLAFGIVGFAAKAQFPSQAGLFVTLTGLVAATQGERRTLRAWPAIVILLLAMPLTSFIQLQLTQQMQLISSQGGVAIIRLFGLPVFRQGNIIDLGAIQLQVAEACSGLRYLFPLATFAFLCAYLFKASRTVKTVVFLSSIPITIFMNSLRIAITAVLVDRSGVEAAQGFFHEFEGWAVFCLCIAILFLEMKLLCYLGGGKHLLPRLDLDIPEGRAKQGVSSPIWAPLAAVPLLCIVTIASEAAIESRAEIILPREQFVSFPRQFGSWIGRDTAIDRETLAKLNPTDYINLDFADNKMAAVNLFITYYSVQYRPEHAVHSPLVCIPGSGWEIERIDVVTPPISVPASWGPLRVNRLTIGKGDQKMLVYYWLLERGVIETSDYRARIKLMFDSLFSNRTDGALVRFVTTVSSPADVNSADERILDLMAKTVPNLPQYLP